jgi:hypothetical protein
MELFLREAARYILPVLALCVFAAGALRGLHVSASAVLSARLHNPLNGDAISLPYYENAVGRHPKCDVVLCYPTISRYHAVISLRKSGWTLIDTASRGGTTCNGETVMGGKALKNGDSLVFGDAHFVFVCEGDTTPPGG